MGKRADISEKEWADIRMLIKFITVFCRENHDGEKNPFSFRPWDIREVEKQESSICSDCARLLTCGLTRRLKCTHNQKPMCKKCETPCYHGEYKSKIREVMRFSGMYFVKHGRLDMLYHYLL